MHPDQQRTDVALVRRLLAAQFPHWAELPIEPVNPYGTDHDIYRLGDRLSVRLPRIVSATAQAATEARWLPVFAPQLPLAIPVPVTMGVSGAGYPFAWSVYEWLPGERVDDGVLHDQSDAATRLAGFVTALRNIDTAGAPAHRPGDRGGPLAERDEHVRAAIAELGSRIDGPLALRRWRESLDAPGWDAADVWIHGDLLPGNLLATDGRLTAVIDFGTLGVGDPAADLIPAWNVFTGISRDRFRANVEVDEATWLRGRGWTLCQALIALPYYWATNPGMVRVASRALAEVLADG